MNYFELFSLSVSPVIDRSTLARTYFDLQKQHHPDYFTQGTDGEQEAALENSATINKAFQILQDPDKTLAYFLQLNGMIETDEKYELPSDFLMEVMEVNEQLGEGEEITAKKRIKELEAEIKYAVQDCLKPNRTLEFSVEELTQLKEYYYKKKYLHRILDRLAD